MSRSSAQDQIPVVDLLGRDQDYHASANKALSDFLAVRSRRMAQEHHLVLLRKSLGLSAKTFQVGYELAFLVGFGRLHEMELKAGCGC
jgi:hypothetical protein